MSSYIVSDKEVKLLAACYCADQYCNIKITEQRALSVVKCAQELLDANYSGVNDRYNENESGKVKWPFEMWSSLKPFELDYWLVADYSNKLLKEFSTIEKLKICQHFEYQCCDKESWNSSKGKRIINRIISNLICELPGWDAVFWGIV